MNKFKKTVLAATAVMLLGLGASAQAAPITGDIAFGGTLNSAMNLATTTVVDFRHNGGGINFLSPVTYADGDLAGLDGTFVMFNDFTFAPLPLGGVTPLWSNGGFSFDLTSATIGPQNANVLALTGSGLMFGPDFTPTPYLWSFSADRNGRSVAFSATNANVPEPASLMLLGAGLAGIGIWRRKSTKI